jgi:anti-anti-sigma factor
MAADLPERGKPVAIEKRKGYLWVTLPDGISVHDYMAIETAIVERLGGVADEVVFDLTEVRALYSSGLGILARIHRRVDKRGGKIYLVNVSRNIMDMLSSLHLDKVFSIHATDVEFEILHGEA